MNKEPRVLAAIYDFLGYLTTRKPGCRIGSGWNPSPIINHLEDWCAQRNIELKDNDISDLIETWSNDDEELRQEYQTLNEAWQDLEKAKQKYCLIRKMITGENGKKL